MNNFYLKCIINGDITTTLRSKNESRQITSNRRLIASPFRPCMPSLRRVGFRRFLRVDKFRLEPNTYFRAVGQCFSDAVLKLGRADVHAICVVAIDTTSHSFTRCASVPVRSMQVVDNISIPACSTQSHCDRLYCYIGRACRTKTIQNFFDTIQ